MLTVDDYGRLRRTHRDGMSIRAIARTLHHSRQKIREVLACPEPRPYTRTKDPPAPKLGPFTPIIDEVLKADEKAPRKQRHIAAQIFRRLRNEHGYVGGYEQVRRYVGKHRRRQRETFIPLVHDPGQRLECDFGHIYVDFPEGRRQVPVLLPTWAYSYCPFAVALPTERTEAILAGMVEAEEGYEQYLLRLTELEVATRSTNALRARIKSAAFPVHKDFDTYDFTVLPGFNKQKVLELARGEWIDEHANCCLIGNVGTGKTHVAIGLGLAACRQGRRVRFFTAANLVNRLEESQKQYQLDRLLTQLDKTDLLICDELGYLSFSRTGAELLFQVFADRYERASLLITSNLAFSDWGQVFQGERMTAALLDRLTHRCHIFEMNGESYRFRESMRGKAGSVKGKTGPTKNKNGSKAK